MSTAEAIDVMAANLDNAERSLLRSRVRVLEAEAAFGSVGDHEPRESLLDRLAARAHDQWSGWMRYLFERCSIGPAGAAVIPPELVQRWQRQVRTPYAQLPRNEQESDRREARRVLEVLRA